MHGNKNVKLSQLDCEDYKTATTYVNT